MYALANIALMLWNMGIAAGMMLGGSWYCAMIGDICECATDG